ncbi:hypothetical protein FHS59_003897 [Algoriphagus iocasae]|uniref:Uncharacterized protein n=1 Tax=Algoriphagus iocasae TaxID=1836499 RepID=A0A841MUH4_9BACT|nr:hypothetical protein [Algoriphagus iocasae]MBB6328254.1 hypothetical protein [Algoriphagus iocasae]
MAIENRISIEIPEADLAAALEHVNAARTILAPFLIALTPEDRRTILKMSDGTRPFVEKVMDYVVSEPQFLPPFLPVEEMQKDWKAVNGLDPILKAANLLCDNLSDTVMLAGSETLEGGLGYYNTTKYAARLNAPNAKGIYEDLKKRFTRKSSSSSPE